MPVDNRSYGLAEPLQGTSGMIQDGTAIGLGLANAVSRIKDSHAKSKVIILLTMVRTTPARSLRLPLPRSPRRSACVSIRSESERKAWRRIRSRPVSAVQYQKYTGRDRRGYVEADRLYHGRAIFPCYGQRQPEGDLFRDRPQMEKTKISVQEYSKKQEEYKNWALLVFALLLVEILLRNTLLRNIP